MLAAALFGAIAAVLAMLTTVYLATDFGHFWLCTVGMSVSLRACADAAGSSELSILPSMDTRRRVPRQLVPGHPMFSRPDKNPSL
jgi:hypothetical protein